MRSKPLRHRIGVLLVTVALLIFFLLANIPRGMAVATMTPPPSDLPKLGTPDPVFDSNNARICWDLIPDAPDKNDYIADLPNKPVPVYLHSTVVEDTEDGTQFCRTLGEGFATGDTIGIRALSSDSDTHRDSDWGEVTIRGLVARLAEPPNLRWEPDKFSWGKVEGAPEASDYVPIATGGVSETARDPSYFAAIPPSPDYGRVHCNNKPAGEGGECWILWHVVNIDMELNVQACANGWKNGFECNMHPSNSPRVSITAHERSLPPLPGCEAEDSKLIVIDKHHEFREYASTKLICSILRFRLCAREQYFALAHAGLRGLASKTDSFIGGSIGQLVSQLHDDLQDWKNEKLAEKELSASDDVALPRDGNFVTKRNEYFCVNTNATPWPTVEFNSNVQNLGDSYYFDGINAWVGWRSVVPELYFNQTVYSPRHFGVEIRTGSGETIETFYVNKDPDSPDILFPFAAEPNETYEIQVWADEETDEARARVRAAVPNLLPVMEIVLPASTPNTLHITINQLRGATFTPTPPPSRQATPSGG